MKPTGNNDKSRGGEKILTDESTIDAITSRGNTMEFIDSWIKSFENNYLHKTTMYTNKMNRAKIPVLIPEPHSDNYKKKI